MTSTRPTTKTALVAEDDRYARSVVRRLARRRRLSLPFDAAFLAPRPATVIVPARTGVLPSRVYLSKVEKRNRLDAGLSTLGAVRVYAPYKGKPVRSTPAPVVTRYDKAKERVEKFYGTGYASKKTHYHREIIPAVGSRAEVRHYRPCPDTPCHVAEHYTRDDVLVQVVPVRPIVDVPLPAVPTPPPLPVEAGVAPVLAPPVDVDPVAAFEALYPTGPTSTVGRTVDAISRLIPLFSSREGK